MLRLRRSDCLDTPIADAGHDLFGVAIVPGIVDDAAYGRHGARQEDAVANGGLGRNLRIQSAGEICTSCEEAIETAVIIRTEACQVIIAKLIDDNANDQFRLVCST